MFFFRVDAKSSLNNPANFVDYLWKEEIYQCDCPPENSTVEDRVLLYGSSSYKQFDVYTGILNCTRENKCVIEHDGVNWTGSLLPNYALQNVTVTTDYENINGVLKLAFKCLFDAKDAYLHNVTW